MNNAFPLFSDRPIQSNQFTNQTFEYKGFTIDCALGKAEKKINGYKFTINIGSKAKNRAAFEIHIDKFNEQTIEHIVDSVHNSGILAPKLWNNYVDKLIFTCDNNGVPKEVKTSDKYNVHIKTIKDYRNILRDEEDKISKFTENNDKPHKWLQKKRETESIVNLMTNIENNSIKLFKIHTNTSSKKQIEKVVISSSEATIEKLKDTEGEQSTWKKFVNWISSPAKELPGLLGALIILPASLAEATLKPVLSERVWKDLSNNVKELGKISIVLLWDIPLKIYEFGASLKDLYNVKDKEDKNKLLDAGLVAIGAFGAFIDIPGRIANVIEIFKPITQVATWAPFLSVISAVLSLASLIFSARSHAASRDLLIGLERKSVKAYLKELRNLAQNGKLDPNVLKAIDFPEGQLNSKILEYIDKQLQVLAKVKNTSDAEQHIAAIQMELDKIPSPLKEQLLAAGDAAYLKCLQKKQDADEDFLKIHFEVDGAKLGNRLKEINLIYQQKIGKEKNHTLGAGESRSAEYMRNAAENLKTRIKDKITSEEVNMTVSSVTLVASAILLAVAFCTAATPAAPIAYIIIIGLSIISIYKIYNDWKRKKEFEAAMGLG